MIPIRDKDRDRIQGMHWFGYYFSQHFPEKQRHERGERERKREGGRERGREGKAVHACVHCGSKPGSWWSLRPGSSWASQQNQLRWDASLAQLTSLPDLGQQNMDLRVRGGEDPDEEWGLWHPAQVGGQWPFKRPLSGSPFRVSPPSLHIHGSLSHSQAES